MKKLILISFTGIIISGILVASTLAAPYRPPPPSTGGNNGSDCVENDPRDECNERNGNGNQNGRQSDGPTPTPCLPNLCWFGETPCCISPMCVLLGTTTADSPEYNRCPEAGKEVRLGKSIVTLPDTLRTAYRFISEFTKSLILQMSDYSKAREK